MKIGLYGGSFSPCRLGHLELMRAVLDAKLVDRIEMIPCNKHNLGKELVDFEDRFEMCFQMTMDQIDIHVKDYEKRWNINGRTFDLVEHVLNEAESSNCFWDTYYLVVGSDCADNIQSWYRWEELIKKIPFIVVADGKNYNSEGWYMRQPHQLVSIDFVDKSRSTDVRRLIREGKSTEGMLHYEVEDYIISKNLYT